MKVLEYVESGIGNVSPVLGEGAVTLAFVVERENRDKKSLTSTPHKSYKVHKIMPLSHMKEVERFLYFLKKAVDFKTPNPYEWKKIRHERS